ncbi:helicase [Kocuria flava]|uniref:Helicase n=2 Tax=Kocuria flava TaxID=446860 RepID=A0A2N4T082_9MICC|nr:helicase [Kocuria flava]
MGPLHFTAGDRLATGLYEHLEDSELSRRLADLDVEEATLGDVDDADSPHVLSRYLSRRIHAHLESLPAGARVDEANRLLAHLDQAPNEPLRIAPGPRQLLAVAPETGQPMRRPTTPLSDAALLTNTPHEPQVGREIAKELESADRVDLLIAFVKWSGLHVMDKELQALKDRGVPFRVLTTVYMGASDAKAINALARKYGAEVRVSYETRNTRLHAKAWMFHRKTGFSTAYVGSSNLSHAAMLDGLEWNVRLSSVATPALLQKFEATFESYWASDGFELYNPDQDGERLATALAVGGGRVSSDVSIAHLDVQPYPYQAQMLQELEAERVIHDRHRNLVVAATGTGKTIVAALDYRRLQAGTLDDLSLLFVAHRREILEQARQTYATVLRDGAFGELVVDGYRPQRGKHVFSSIQSLNANALDRFSLDSFDVVVIDEFHHADAPTYRRIIEHFRPQELLGLTATPERGDGVNVAERFFDGRIASELRLWDALDQQLLTPFHYFGVSDGVDLSSLQFRRGRYEDRELDAVYTGNDARTAKVLQALNDKVLDPHRMKAIGFCVSVEHAKYMARKFNEAGLPSAALSGESSSEDRRTALKALQRGELRAVFAVDLFNEGLDIPQVDTILMLRPTQSSTLFLQQLGRGLRLAPDKPVLTVLDFIGFQHREFRFDMKYRAVTGSSRTRLAKDLEDGFPFLPSGTQIVFDTVAQSVVLNNVKRQLRLTTRQVVEEIKDLAAQHPSPESYTLRQYLTDSLSEASDIYRRSKFEGRPTTWNTLRRAGGLVPDVLWPAQDREVEVIALLQRAKAFLNVDDPARLRSYAALLQPDAPPVSSMPLREQRMARMLYYSFWPQGVKSGGPADLDSGLQLLRSHAILRDELAQLIDVTADDARNLPQPLGQDYTDIPLQTHAHYTREELLAGLGMGEAGQRTPGTVREGVSWISSSNCEALLVTLHKSEKDFSPNTMYKDYAISETLFHWESQNQTTPESSAGQRYQHHAAQGAHIMLFVRESPTQEAGTSPYVFLGPVDYVSHEGSKPMSILWRLRRPMPSTVFSAASTVAPLS